MKTKTVIFLKNLEESSTRLISIILADIEALAEFYTQTTDLFLQHTTIMKPLLK